MALQSPANRSRNPSHVQNVGSFDHLVGVVDVEVGGCGPEQLANLQGLLESEEARIFLEPNTAVAMP